MQFVYKLDHLFKSTRVADENSSVSKAFHFSKLISTQDFFCIQHATFKATYKNLNPFWLHLLFFMHLMIYFELNDPEIGKHYKWTHKRLKLCMVSKFDRHNLCAKVERIMAKTGCTSCTNWTISFKVIKRVSHENSYVSKAFHFSKLISIQDFFPFIMHHSKPHNKNSTLSDFICYFTCT